MDPVVKFAIATFFAFATMSNSATGWTKMVKNGLLAL
jgi:hypothetical protein